MNILSIHYSTKGRTMEINRGTIETRARALATADGFEGELSPQLRNHYMEVAERDLRFVHASR